MNKLRALSLALLLFAPIAQQQLADGPFPIPLCPPTQPNCSTKPLGPGLPPF